MENVFPINRPLLAELGTTEDRKSPIRTALVTHHSPLITKLTSPSFLPQRHNWIDSSGALGRNDAGAKPD